MYRVPTNDDWSGVHANNTSSRTGTWTNSATNYNSALHYGPNASTKLLTLPTAGYRDNADGTLVNRGSIGNYWSSIENGTNANNLYFNSSIVTPVSLHSRILSFSLRCIAE